MQKDMGVERIKPKQIGAPINPRADNRRFDRTIEGGYLVLIGPTPHNNGKPVEIGQIPHAAAMFVAWCAKSPQRLVRRLQNGNPERLTVYGRMEMTQDGVAHLCSRLAEDHIRGHWFKMSPRLIQALRFVHEEVGLAVAA